VLAVERATGADREALLDVLRAPDEPNDEATDRVVRIMERLGVRERVADLVDERFETLEQLVREALPPGREGLLVDLCHRLRVRDY
jgi:hypothetical protein